MEHIYTIKVKRKFDPRGQYPSERRYSASTVYGFCWVYCALGCTSFLLACLSAYNPVIPNPNPHLINYRETKIVPKPTLQHARVLLSPNGQILEQDLTYSDSNVPREEPETVRKVSEDDEVVADNFAKYDTSSYEILLFMAPCLLAVSGFLSACAALLASKRWYIDQSIAWFFLTSIISLLVSLLALTMIAVWVSAENEASLSFCDYFSDGDLFKKAEVEIASKRDEIKNHTASMYIIKIPVNEMNGQKLPLPSQMTKENRTRKVLSINIIIAGLIQLIWALLSLKISWNGMRSAYPDDDVVNNRGNLSTVQVVTELKGNNVKRLPKNTKILPPKPDLIEHYPKNNKIKKFFQSQQENGGFFLQNQNGSGLFMIGPKDKSDFSPPESSSEYRERMMNFLNKCASNEGVDLPESIAEPETLELTEEPVKTDSPMPDISDNKKKNRLSAASWGDVHDFPIYDQNSLDLDSILSNLRKKTEAETKNDEPDIS